MARWIFKLHDSLDDRGIAVFEELPAVRAWSRKITAPENAASLVRDRLVGRGTRFEVLLPEDPIRDRIKDATHAVALLRPEVAGLGKFPDYLMPWQFQGIGESLTWPNGSGLFCWAAGSGKTIAAIIWALAGLGRVVVVTKAAVKYQWAGEVKRITFVEPSVLEGEKPHRLGDAKFVILSYEILPAWISAIEEWSHWYKVKPSVVFDESQKVSSKKRWTATVDVAAEDASSNLGESSNGRTADFGSADGGSSPSSPTALPLEPIAPPKVKFTLNDNIAAGAMRLSAIAARRLLTTATPIRDRVRNLWAQLDLAHPYEWGKYWDWAKRYTGAVEKTFGGMDDTGATNLDELKVRIDVSTHRVRHEEANAGLPPKRRTVVYLPAAIQVASGMTKEVRAAAKSGDPTALREVLLLEACARKRPWLLGQIEARVDDGQKVVIFTGRRKECDELLEKCRSKWPGALIVGGHGGHLAEERDATKDRYMAAPGPAILIGTTDAWGEGLNLQDSDALYQALLPATPGQIIQAEGRVSRLGQRRSVEIVYPVCEGTIDERLAGILLTKLPALERVVDQDEVRSFARELSGVDDKDLLAGLAAKILTRVKGDG